MTSSLPSLSAMYAKAAMPTRTKTPTMSSSFVSCMGTGPPGLPGGDNFGPGPDSNELPHGGMPGPLELFRRCHLDDHPVQQHRDVIRDAEDFRDLVAHHDGREPELPLSLDDQIMDGPRQEGIQSGGGLVEQDDLRPHDERTGQSGPLPHAAAEFRGELVPHARESDRLQHLKDLPPDLRFFHFRLLPQGKGHVFKNVERVEQRRALEQHRKFLPHLVELARAQPGDIDLVHQHLAAIRLQQPDHMLEQHTLAAAALADHRGDFSPGNLQVDSLQDRLPPERLFHPDEANHRLRPLLAFHHSACVVLTSRPRSQNSPKSGSRRRTAPPPRSWRFPVLRRSSSYCTLYTYMPRTRSRRS